MNAYSFVRFGLYDGDMMIISYLVTNKIYNHRRHRKQINKTGEKRDHPELLSFISDQIDTSVKVHKYKSAERQKDYQYSMNISKNTFLKILLI